MADKPRPGRPAKNGHRPKRPSARVNEIVSKFDEEEHNRQIENDIEHGVLHNGGTANELEEHVEDMSMLACESDGLFKDVFGQMTEDDYLVDFPGACTLKECLKYRGLLRSIGPRKLCERTLDPGLITAKKLLTAFGVRPPELMEGYDDDAYLSLLSLAFLRELHKRVKLPHYNSIEDAVGLLKSARNIIVLTGAGISTSLGIPDFRSKGTGLYAQLEHLGLNDPQEVFDIRVFKQDPTIFYSVAKDILPTAERYTPTHAFIALLQEKGKLLTNYTQNIDNLELKAGIKPEKLVQCHGSFATASCMKCGYKVNGETIFPEIRAGKVPRCRRCLEGRRQTNNSRKRKLARDGTEKKVRRRPGDQDSNSDSEFDNPSRGGGIMKPDITFFSEELPQEFSRRLQDRDRYKVDLVVVIGTSLKVRPVSELVSFLPANVPQIYISRTPVAHVNFDIDMLGDCDVVVSELCRRAGWDLKHEMIPKGQKVNVELQDGFTSRYDFAVVHPKPEAEL